MLRVRDIMTGQVVSLTGDLSLSSAARGERVADAMTPGVFRTAATDDDRDEEDRERERDGERRAGTRA